MPLHFTVWQFVRIMVHAEEVGAGSVVGGLLEDWREVWEPLDAELGELAERDFDAYGDLMMNQDVVIEDATPAQAKTARAAVDAVMAEMDAAITAAGDPAHLENLKYERRELRQLSRRLGRLADGDGAGEG
ncbi:MAG: hypothetical protein HQL36_10240 [Alphaproteobacteria bacterium]|nr:hypothetical protein [Alphaproteobacteria bacterium]